MRLVNVSVVYDSIYEPMSTSWYYETFSFPFTHQRLWCVVCSSWYDYSNEKFVDETKKK